MLIHTYALTKDLPAEADKQKEPDFNAYFENYKEMERLFLKWDEGFCGSRKFYKNKLKEYLYGKFRQGIVTDYNYMFVFPEVLDLYTPKFNCRLRYGSWLHIAGPMDAESFKRLVGDDKSLLGKWWRSKRLLSLYGKIVRVKLEERDKRSVTLYFDSIKFREVKSR
jgi:hypothetical protein